MAIHLQIGFPVATRSGVWRGSFWVLAAWIRAATARWRQRRLLEELDDRMLRDMGISRSQALAEAVKPFWRA
jgi:uncharacterized protein YjiS (DUF1127 family)